MKPFSVAILVPSDYWRSNPVQAPGNHVTHRSLPNLCSALRRAGARPSCLTEDTVYRPGDFDGLVLPGGGDIDPSLYGQSVGPGMQAETLRPHWDRFQLAWARHYLEAGLPVFGICRGMQLLNVARGGTLIQDLELWGSPLQHAPAEVLARPELRRREVHALRIEADSELARSWSGQAQAVNSIHHQAVDRLGQDWRAVAWAEDGVIEALEDQENNWQQGVQFHPEDMIRQSAFQGLFHSWVRASRQALRA